MQFGSKTVAVHRKLYGSDCILLRRRVLSNRAWNEDDSTYYGSGLPNNKNRMTAYCFHTRRSFATTTTTTTTAQSDAETAEELKSRRSPIAQPTLRPAFPWRHEKLENILPFFDPTSKHFRRPLPYNMQRFAAYWYLDVSVVTCIFGFGSFRHELAEDAAYAFAQTIWNMKSNIFQEQLNATCTTTTTTTKENENVGSGGSGKEPTLAKKSEEMKTDGRHPAFATPEETVQATDNVISKDPSQISSDSQVNETVTTTATEAKNSANLESTTKSDTTEAATNTTKDESKSKKPDVTFVKLDLSKMLIEPLHKLYKSAHESGRDQFLIRLETEVQSAHFLNLNCIPYISRENTKNDPRRLPTIRNIRKKGFPEGMKCIYSYLESDLEKTGQLETTMELQVLLVCHEIFQVTDRKTGQVIQGTTDGSQQIVGHVVRLERTIEQTINESNNSLVVNPTEWQISDIDDMLTFPIAWYEK